MQTNVGDAYDPGDKPASSLCTAKALKAEAKKDRAMLHDGGGLGFSVCYKDSWN